MASTYCRHGYEEAEKNRLIESKLTVFRLLDKDWLLQCDKTFRRGSVQYSIGKISFVSKKIDKLLFVNCSEEDCKIESITYFHLIWVLSPWPMVFKNGLKIWEVISNCLLNQTTAVWGWKTKCNWKSVLISDNIQIETNFITKPQFQVAIRFKWQFWRENR